MRRRSGIRLFWFFLFVSAAGLAILPGCLPAGVKDLLDRVGLGPSADVTREVVCGPGVAGQVNPSSLPVYQTGVRIVGNRSYAHRPGVERSLNSVDFYVPERGYCHPVMVFIHGGGWIGGDKEHVGMKPETFVRAGYLFASVNYRLSPAVRHPEHVKDVAKAIRFVRDQALKYRGDPGEIFLIAHSAGAHLAALVATDHRYLAAEGLPLTALRGVILLDGAGYDMPLQMTMTGGPQFDLLYRMAFSNNPRLWENASPIRFVGPSKGIPPFLMFHLGPGQATGVQAMRFGQVLEKAHVPVELHFARGVSHSALNSRFGQPGDETTRSAFRYLNQLRW